MKVPTDQLFIVTEQLLRALSVEEIDATYADMEELGIAGLPYPEVDLIIAQAKGLEGITYHLGSKSATFKMGTGKSCTVFPDGTYEFKGENHRIVTRDAAVFDKNGKPVDLDIDVREGLRERIAGLNEQSTARDSSYAELCETLKKMLVVLLATRNIIKDTRESKLSRLGIGKKHRYRYTTTLKVGTIIEEEGNGGLTGTRRPHLRRGHIRKQRFGPNHCMVKKIFVQPTFVNADESFINMRTAYNLSHA